MLILDNEPSLNSIVMYRGNQQLMNLRWDQKKSSKRALNVPEKWFYYDKTDREEQSISNALYVFVFGCFNYFNERNRFLDWKILATTTLQWKYLHSENRTKTFIHSDPQTHGIYQFLQ